VPDAPDHPARLYRLARNLSMREVADACGVDQTTIWRIETGRSKPSGETLMKMAQVLRVPAGAIIGTEIYAPPAGWEDTP